MQKIDIYRSGVFFVSVKQDTNSSQIKRVMGDNLLPVSFEDSNYYDFRIGDYCTVFGETYTLNKLPTVEKKSIYFYSYTLPFEGSQYNLRRAQYMFLDPANSLMETDFSLMGDPAVFIDLLLDNMARVDTGWTKGQVIPGEAKHIDFTKSNCYDALNQIAETFGTEWWVVGKTIHLTKMTKDTGKQFELGRFKGLYTITRTNLDTSTIATRLYAFGSTRNIPNNYRGAQPRLLLPDTHSGLISDLNVTYTPAGSDSIINFSFNDPADSFLFNVLLYRAAGSNGVWSSKFGQPGQDIDITVPTGSYEVRFETNGGPYSGLSTPTITISGTSGPFYESAPIFLEKNVAQYGLIEDTVIFEDVYPHRTGTVTGVDATNEFVFSDSTIDFDLNNYLLGGISAKVTFNTGQLGGYTFEIQTPYDDTTKTITILKNKEETAMDVPSPLLRPAIGDEYVFTDISMPQSYIDAAEQELKGKAEDLLDTRSIPQAKYMIDFDPTYLRNQNFIPAIGDEIWIKDNQFNVQRKIRVITTTRNLQTEERIQVELADFLEKSKVDRIINNTSTNSRNISGIQAFIENRAELNGIASYPVYADEAAATAGGLTSGKLYRTPTGEIKVKL